MNHDAVGIELKVKVWGVITQFQGGLGPLPPLRIARWGMSRTRHIYLISYYHADAKSNGGVSEQKQSRASQLTRCRGWTYAIMLMPSLGFWMKMLWWIFRRDSKNVTDPLLALVTVKSATATVEEEMKCSGEYILLTCWIQSRQRQFITYRRLPPWSPTCRSSRSRSRPLSVRPTRRPAAPSRCR